MHYLHLFLLLFFWLPTLAWGSPIENSALYTKVVADVREHHKSSWDCLADPVDIISGAFYIDEVDLTLPGAFSFAIRRNYNSQNPLRGAFGYGWKLSLNPALTEVDDKLFASEEDGTVIVYRLNEQKARWEVFPQDNPDLRNLSAEGLKNPFHNYIENDILYGSDGSKRFFEDHLLKRWVTATGNSLLFSYENNLLVKIESFLAEELISFCKISYDPEGRISEIFTKDGRSIRYTYSSAGDLETVKLPNEAVITYEYDHLHRLFRETKPHGRVLENIYDLEGRVRFQRSPIFQENKMGISATFTYEGDTRTATDASGATSTYKLFDKRIYKIIDPDGYETLQSWFIDANSYFDPEKEAIVSFDGPGGWPQSLKSSKDKRGLTVSYLYDSKGNPEVITLIGDDLTGDGQSSVSKKLSYNENNLCVAEETLGKKTVTTYDDTFSTLPKKIEITLHDKLLSFVLWEYNPMGQIRKENRAGSVTLYDYDSRWLPSKITRETGTSDPDVVTSFTYNHLGQCNEKTGSDGLQKDEYDTSGNRLSSHLYSPSGKLLSESYLRYNLNNQPILSYGPRVDEAIHLDYNASGLLKSSRQLILENNATAYTLYDYDTRGLLSEEVDPIGNCTYRKYDALSRLKTLIQDNHLTSFTYEAGGLLAVLTSPSGSRTIRSYTTNGLLKEEISPSGTRHSFIYDFSGRIIQEEQNGLISTTAYDDLNSTITKRLQDKLEIRQFDVRGNLIRLTDTYGYVYEKTYDNLNRITSETTPTGEKTSWSYQGDTVICRSSTGEKTVTRYEMGQAVESITYNSAGDVISSSSSSYDQALNVETDIQGDIVTVTKRNSQGKPLLITSGDQQSSFSYDLAGNNLTSTDGDGCTTTMSYDALGRVRTKTLPDGALITYEYDRDSNLIECHMPTGLMWKASYDCMGRKEFEELLSNGLSSQTFTYTYENDLLKESTDPLGRVHTYDYDSYHRLTVDEVEDYSRTYTYNLLDAISSIKEVGKNSSSFIERTYDPSGRITLESIYLDSELIQETKQTWKAASRSLEIGNHHRELFYQQGQLNRVISVGVDLSYEYDFTGALIRKTSPFSYVTLDYNEASLPKKICSTFLGNTSKEILTWKPSGKLAKYNHFQESHYLKTKKTFTYNARGQLQSSDEGTYEFDFGSPGLGIRTLSPKTKVPTDGLDSFGLVHTETTSEKPLETSYNPMGEVLSQNDKKFTWDPWGRLLSVSSDTYTWKASYDALGRRLRMHYLPFEGEEVITTSFYDPEKEFEEIGVKQNEKIFWKIYGPTGCDAVLDETDSLYLLQNALGSLSTVVSSTEIFYPEEMPSLYGPTNVPPPSHQNLLSYALSLSWQNKSVDPTGLIWMGARYYDPTLGRFLSPDPISYPICLDLYNYANGDPVNYNDPDGRFSSKAFQTIKASVIDVIRDPRSSGYMQGGFGSAGVLRGAALMGSGALASTTVIGSVVGIPTIIYGGMTVVYNLDSAIAGMRTASSGGLVSSATVQLLEATGMSKGSAAFVDGVLGTMLDMGASKLTKGSAYIGSRFASSSATLTKATTITESALIKAIKQPRFRSFTQSNYRHNLKVLTGIDPGSSIQAHHVFPREFEGYFHRCGMNIHDPKYLAWWQGTSHMQNAKDYIIAWNAFKHKNPNPSIELILQKGREIMSDYKKSINF